MAAVRDLKKDNIRSVRACFYRNFRPWTRPELAADAGLSMAGTENILKLLTDRGEIRYSGDAPSTGGRCSKQYTLVPDYAHIGMMFLSHRGHRYIVSVSSSDLSGKEVFRKQISAPSAGIPELEDALRTLLEADPAAACLQVSIPGIVSPDGAVKSNDFPLLSDPGLRQTLERMTGLPVSMENDVNLAAAGYGRLRPECRSLAVLYQPDEDPAGAGILINGKILHGRSGFAGEIGRLCRADQLRLLKENPSDLIALQIALLTCTVAPDRIAWCCPLLTGPVRPEAFSVFRDIPPDMRPVLEKIGDLNALSRAGADLLGRETLLDHTF